MGYLKVLIFGLVIGFLLDGCATPAGFIYKYYGMDAVSYDGNLLGPKPVNDLSLKLCEPIPPTATHPGKSGQCVVMLRDEFFKMKGDFLILEKNLIACQQGYKPR